MQSTEYITFGGLQFPMLHGDVRQSTFQLGLPSFLNASAIPLRSLHHCCQDLGRKLSIHPKSVGESASKYGKETDDGL